MGYDTEEEALAYENIKKHLIESHIMIPSTHNLVEYDLKGKRVIDLACGSGWSTRNLADLEPDELIGVDLSEKMIDLANKLNNNHENLNYSKLKFHVADCMNPQLFGQFDVVFSSHLLNYFENQDDLFKVYKSMFEQTKPGGICYGLLASPFLNYSDPESICHFKKNGKEVELLSSGVPLKVRVRLSLKNESSITFINYLWPAEIQEKHALSAGFSKFEWIKPILGSQFKESFEFFQSYLDNPCTYGFKAYKN